MKKVLVVIPDLHIGGAQKSLISFLNALCVDNADAYDISLMTVRPHGAFQAHLPAAIKPISPPRVLRWLGLPLNTCLFTRYFSLRGIAGELVFLLRKICHRFPQDRNAQQNLWESFKRFVPVLNERYDVAVSYMDGYANYYVMDRVQADKKVLWVHNEYRQHVGDPTYDRRFFEAADGIMTISDTCRECIVREFPLCADRVHVLENIVSDSLLTAQAAEPCPLLDNTTALKLVSVGRLSAVKGYDMAIQAAALLRDTGIPFVWLVVGDGPERETLTQMIQQAGLETQFCLVGATENPYPYMRACDIVVHPSRTEGKSIVVDEAKRLAKPIVVTNYTTVADAVTHNENGLVVDMHPAAICDGIGRLYHDTALRENICARLREQTQDNRPLLTRYIQLMFE